MDHRHLSFSHAVDMSLNDILTSIKPSELDQTYRFQAIDNFKNFISSIPSLKDATIKPFGSFASNLHTRWGDLDISIETSDAITLRRHKQKLLRDVTKALQRKGYGRKLQFIPNARIPVVIFESSYQNISFDISVNNFIGYMKSKLLSWISEIDERFRDIVLLVKEWAKSKNINDPKTGTLNSYSLCLLIIFHFQTCKPAILPPLKDIYEGNVEDDLSGPKTYIEERIKARCLSNIAKFKLQRSQSINQSSFSQIREWNNLVICPYSGQLEPMYNNRKWLQKTYYIRIEDPFEQSDNTAKAVGMFQLLLISDAFKETYQMFSSHKVQFNRETLLKFLVRPHIRSRIEASSSRIVHPNNVNSRDLYHRSDLSSTSPTTLEQEFQSLRLENRTSTSNGIGSLESFWRGQK